MILEEREIDRLERLEVVLAVLVARRALAVDVVVVERDAARADAVDSASCTVRRLMNVVLPDDDGPAMRDDAQSRAARGDGVGDAADALLVEALADADELATRCR